MSRSPTGLGFWTLASRPAAREKCGGRNAVGVMEWEWRLAMCPRRLRGDLEAVGHDRAGVSGPALLRWSSLLLDGKSQLS
jgi:hypothetical protein